MKLTKYLKCLFLALFLLDMDKTYAVTVDIDLLPYSKATYLASRGRNKQAAEQWHKLTRVFMRSEAKLGEQEMWQYAGLSEALAAIAADKENNSIAYQYWADSTRYLMTGGTNWKQMQKSLYRRYKTADMQLSIQLPTNQLAPGIDERWQKELATLQIWDEKLDLFSFDSPKLGLKTHLSSAPLPSQAPPPRAVYYAPSVPGKKLTGLKTSFSREKHLVPTGAPLTTPQPSARIDDAPTEQKIIFETEAEAKNRLIDVDRVLVLPVGSIQTNKPNPLVRGSQLPAEETNVEALQRRGVNPESN